MPVYAKTEKEQIIQARIHFTWKGSQEVTLTLKAGPARSGCSGLHPAQIWTSWIQGVPRQCLTSVRVKTCSQYLIRIPLLVIKACCLSFCLCTFERSLTHLIWTLPLGESRFPQASSCVHEQTHSSAPVSMSCAPTCWLYWRPWNLSSVAGRWIII